MQKSSRNALANVSNRFQGPEPRVLFVCSAGLLRSVTAAQLFCQAPWNWNTRGVGVFTDFALVPISESLIHWADLIILMEEHHLTELANLWDTSELVFKQPWIKIAEKCRVLGIPDDFSRMQPELVELLKQRVSEVVKTEETEG